MMMKTLALALLVGAACAAPMTPDENQALWKIFKQTHNKNYGASEDFERFTLFMERVKMMNEHNERFHAGKTTYSMGLNKHADWTVAELMHRNGYRQQNRTDTTRVEFVNVGAGLPATVDWRTKGAVTGVKDQGQCGSCWSFGTTGTTEGQLFLATGDLVPLSEQELVDCDTSWDQGCNGGLPEYAFKYIEGHGLMKESDYTYHARQSTCKYDKSKVVANIKGYKSIAQNSESDLKTAAANVGPIAVGIDASHMSFQLYSGGVYDEPRCSSTRLDHAVLVVGYGTDNGKDYWLVKNSWGTSWGLDGYIKMSRNANNQCGIAHDATYPTGVSH